jgi:outer membrane protein assembly factor BamB
MLMGCVALSSSVMGQQVVETSDGSETVTNQLPGFSIRKEQRPVIDAFEDFERYRDKKAWEKAFTALGKIEDGKPGRLVPDKDGFYVPTDLKIRAELLSLPPDGREAYRLFNDAKATQLLRDLTPADGSVPADEIAGLSKVVNRYFVTAIGDQAADRLGDAYFEMGDFPNAQRCWGMILENYPDSSLSVALLQTKRAIALARAGDWDQFEAVRSILHDRYAGQTAHIAGQDVVASNFVDGLKPGSIAPKPASPGEANGLIVSNLVAGVSGDPLVLPANDRPAWQIPIMDSLACGQLNTALGQSGWGQMAGQFTNIVPATGVDEKRVYVNWLGICFALDIKTGKMIWRTDSFGDMPTKMAQSLMQGISIDPRIYSVTTFDDKVLFTRRSTDNQDYNQMPMTRLMCVTGIDGKAVWKSETGPLSGWGFVGSPMIKGDVFYSIAHANNSQDLSLICVGLARGDVRWKTDLGTPASSMNWRGQPLVPNPVLLQQAGKIFILTNNGAFIQVDCTSHQVDWALSYPTYVEPQQQYWGNAQPQVVAAPGTMLSDGATIYFKEYNSTLLFALDPSGPTVKWKRRIDSEGGLAGFDGRNLLLAGPEIECVDRESRVLRWDTRTSMNSGTLQPVIQGGWLCLFGARGVDSINLTTGDRRPPFRGYDHDSDGGTLWKTSTRLVTVSSRAITAYPLAGK